MFKRTLFILFLSIAIISCNKNLNYTSTRILIKDSLLTDSNIFKVLNPYKLSIDNLMDKSITFCKQNMDKGIPESLLGNFVADLVFQQTKNIDSSIELSLLNNGGLRSTLYKGNITLGNIFELMPFDNSIVIVTISYENTLKLFNYLSQVGGQPISNAKFTNINKTPKKIVINNRAIENKNYTIVTSDYLASGGDNMSFFSNPVNYKNTGILLRDAIIEYCILNDTINSELDGRIN